MPIDDHLLRDEKILASTSGVGKATLYATNQRVIRYEKGLLGEKVDSLYYAHITSASLTTKSYLWLVVPGALIIIIGVAAGGRLGALLFLLGVVLALVGIFYKPARYQLKVVGLSSKELKRWRTASAREGAKTFARFIQDQISAREVPIPSAPITPSAKSTKTYCRHCGSEIPTDSVYCSRCGKRIAP
jgi:ribosomal protein L40E